MSTGEKKTKAKPRARTTPKSKQKTLSKLDTTKHTLSLMALSPYRFPLDVQKLALQGARIGSLAFIFFGILFSYHYLESAMTGVVMEATQAAQVNAAFTCGEACVKDTQTPAVQFTYEETVGAQLIQVTVPEATSVTIHAYDVLADTYLKLGSARNIGGDTWEYVWLTDEVPHGNYWIKAVVTNQYGMYDRSDSEFVTVR